MPRAEMMLDLYRAEREHLNDPLFGEPFPDFKAWRAVYEADFRQNHITVTTEEADVIMDQIVEQAVSELNATPVMHVPFIPACVDETPPVVTDVVVELPKAEVKPHRAARAKGPAKAAVVKTKKVKKSDIVRALLADKANQKLARPELLALLQKEAKLSQAAANTYMYQYRTS